MEIQARTITRPSMLIDPDEKNPKLRGKQYWGPLEFTCDEPAKKVYGKHNELTIRVTPDEIWVMSDVRIAVYGHEEQRHYTAVFDSIKRIA